MRRLITKIASPGLKFFIKHYFKKARGYRIGDIKATVLPGVFFPHFTHSTAQFVHFLKGQQLKGNSLLELGCGTAIISVFAAKNGAIATASDINPKAVENAQLNAVKNEVELNTVLSDLFTKIEAKAFDFIIINPPYYPKAPKNMAEKAWYCGEEFGYFKNLFSQLPAYMQADNNVFMILSEDCPFNEITTIAAAKNIEFDVIDQNKKWGEWTMIYKLTKLPAANSL